VPADLVLIGGLLAAAAATLGWLALLAALLGRAEAVRFPPRGAWVLLCVFSPVGAVVYLAADWAWRRRPSGRKDAPTSPAPDGR
jgi:hypothetical protein